MTVVDTLIEKFGSQGALARAAGVKQPTVFGWKQSGLVPARRQRAILDAAKERGIDVSPADFFQPEERTAP